MTEIEIKFAPRYIKRKRSNAIGKSVLKTLTEPITNSDDSYRRLISAVENQEKQAAPIDIYIDRNKRLVRITDHAEGMSLAQLEQKFEYYGSDKSGASQGKDVRGLFGQGISDTLLYHANGVIKTIKDGEAAACQFYEKNGKPFIKIDEIKTPLETLSKSWGIKGAHGTTVEFVLDEDTHIPEYDKLIDKLSSFYMLRFINADDNRKVRIVYANSKGKRESTIKYTFPKGELVQQEEFSMNFEAYNPIKIEAEIYRSNEHLITMGEEQQNGLLVYDDKKTVYDLTFFGLDGQPSTDKFFGFVKLTGAREIILDKINHEKHPEEILTDSRDGFNRSHEFYKKLEQIMRDWLYPILNEERKKRANDGFSETTKEKHRKALTELNKLYSQLAGDDSSGTITTRKPSRPAGGLAFARNHIQITAKRKYNLQLIIDTRVIKPDSIVRIKSANGKVGFSPSSITIERSDRDDELLIKSVALRGNESESADTITASCGRRNTSVVVSVVHEEIFYPENGLAFHPDYIAAIAERDTSLNLYVDLKLIKKGSKIKITSSNKTIELRKSFVVPKPNLWTNKQIAKIPVVFKGNVIGESGSIEAVFGNYQANARVDIRDKKEITPPSHTGKFKDWDFDENIGAPYQHIFDSNPKSATFGYILINPNHPINKKYFGENPIKSDVEKLPQSQLYLAEVILNESLNIIVTEALKKGGLPRRLGDDYDVLFYISEKKYQHGGTIYDLFGREELPRFEAKMQKKAKEWLPSGMPEDVDDREKSMIELRFGLNEQRPHTLDEISRKFGVTRERVRQIILSALGKKYEKEGLNQPTEGDITDKTYQEVERDYIQEEEERISNSKDRIITNVAKSYGLTRDEIMEKTRRADVVMPRQIAMYLTRELIGLSFPSIGTIFGRDHTTAMHAYRKINLKLKNNPKLEKQLEHIAEIIKGK